MTATRRIDLLKAQLGLLDTTLATLASEVETRRTSLIGN
jgi:hypothetical protein